ERIMAVYRNRMPDQIPVSIYNRYLRSGEVERTARNMGLGILYYYPVVSLLAPPWHIQPGYVSEVKGVSFNINISWENGEAVETLTYETPLGMISQQVVKDPSYGSDWRKKHYIESAEDYRVMQYVVENTVFCREENTIRQKIEDLGEDGVVLGRIDRSPYQKLLIELVGAEKFLVDFYTDPQPALELMEAIEARLDEQFELALESKVEVIWQPENITADLTPPEQFKKYCLPLYERRSKRCRDAGKVYVVHMDGRLNAIKDLIASSSIDVIESFSFAEMSGDLPVSEAKAIWPDKVLCPNFPSSLCEKPQKEIENYLEQVLTDFGKETPFMIQISEDIPLDTYGHVLPVLCAFMEGHRS
ncbi:MAG: uroporphyrinogen decarboxylase family protein, partial [Gemmatimonadota bacterium]|nr:uroporphyrinogen decarboxylase family protein [Gemmatimonadota bacterium]